MQGACRRIAVAVGNQTPSTRIKLLIYDQIDQMLADWAQLPIRPRNIRVRLQTSCIVQNSNSGPLSSATSAYSTPCVTSSTEDHGATPAIARPPTPHTPFAARLANLVRSWVPCTLPRTLPCTPLMSADRPAPSAAPPPTARAAAALSPSTAQSAAARATAARTSPAVPGPTEALHPATVSQPVAAEHWLHSHRPLTNWQQRKQRRRTRRQSRCRRPHEHGRLTRHLLRRHCCCTTDATLRQVQLRGLCQGA